MFFNKSDKLKNKLNQEIDKLNNNLEKSNIVELSYILNSKKEIAKRNFLAGIFRGFGIGIGITIITAIILIVLQKLVKLNIPIIGEYIADIVDIVKTNTAY